MAAFEPQATVRPTRVASATRPVYEVLAHDLRALDAPIFGLMSDDTMLLASTLDAMGVPFHGARHENSAIAMADGWASASGQLGLALIGRGPAAANSLHAAVSASRTGSKLLLMYGDAPIGAPPPNELGPDGKALNAEAVLAAAGIRTFVARSPAGARETLRLAIAHARRGEAVALLLPVDVQTAEIEFEGDAAAAAPTEADAARQSNAARAAAEALAAARRPRDSGRASPGSIAAAAAVLQSSRKPLFVCGVGAVRAGAREAIERLADRLGAVLATSLKAKDFFRGHPFDVGVIGSFSHSAGRRLMDEADCIVVFGASFNQRTTSAGAALAVGAPIVHVDRERSHIGRWGPADVGIVGDAKVVAEQLLDAMPARPAAEQPLRSEENRLHLAQFEWTHEFRPEHTPRTVDPRALALELDRLLPPDRNLVFDSGNFVQTLPFFSTLGPQHLKLPWDFFSVGMAFGTALGFAKARTDQTTVLVIGDGGLLMTLGELETAVREDVPLVILVMNDCAYGAELHYLRLENMPVAPAMFPDVDYAPVAEAFGFRTATIRTLDQLREAAPLLRSRDDGPVLLDCKINAAICGPYIAEAAGHLKK
ncbi:MAG: thiamine pyrophosphate-binding protein [Burkholderiaceae bacterium]|nr:thiamine pyrophosphate-binding protein [Burkholderiaceae bacterium]